MLELYWQFFLTGISLYAILRLIYFFININSQVKMDNKKRTDFINGIGICFAHKD